MRPSGQVALKWIAIDSEELLDFYFSFDFGGSGTRADAMGIKVEGNYWFKDEEGSTQTGAWKDDGDICEITRGYRRSESGYVRAVRP
ncbi:MAG: hypothetical protein KKG47_09620 [Proteobacteria bacterium]|nr:hypothetical protein [Pseudomonadota bacterium]MBU1736876.1 hypothetical protein [Pseudomonadota bacterium]